MFLKYVSQCGINGVSSSEQTLRTYANDTAVTTGKMTFKTKGGEALVVVTQLWVRQNGAWRLASHHTTLPPARR